MLGLVALYGCIYRKLLTPSPQYQGAASVETYAILSLLQLFISPIVWSHYYIWLFWPMLWLLAETLRGRTRRRRDLRRVAGEHAVDGRA